MTSLTLAVIEYLKSQNITLNGNEVRISASFPVKEAEIPCIVVTGAEGVYDEISIDSNIVFVKETVDVNVYARNHNDRDSLCEQVENAFLNTKALSSYDYDYVHLKRVRSLDLPKYGIFRSIFLVEAFRFITK